MNIQENRQEPLQYISYISVPLDFHPDTETPYFDPSRLLPVELPPGEEEWRIQDLSWEMIIAAMLKILAYNPDHKDADYYRTFILSTRPDIVDELTQGGIYKAQNKDFILAEEIFLSLCGLLQEDAAPRINLALVYEQHAEIFQKVGKEELREKYYSLAFSAYLKALSIDNKSPDVHYYAGNFYFRQEAYEKTVEHFSFYMEFGEDEKRKEEIRSIQDKIQSQKKLDTLFKESYDYIRLGQEEDGINKIREFLKLNPEVSNAWFLLGWAWRRLGNYSEAKDAFIKAIEIGPKETDMLNELAICTMELGDYKSSRKYLSDALKQEPENIKIISNMGILAIKENNYEEAEGFFRTVLEIEPEDKIAIQYLDYLHSRQ